MKTLVSTFFVLGIHLFAAGAIGAIGTAGAAGEVRTIGADGETSRMTGKTGRLLRTSAYREPLIDFHQYVEPLGLLDDQFGEGQFSTVLNEAVKIADINWSQVPAQETTLSKAKDLFVYLRDKRAYTDNNKFQRRLTWLFPDDGCSARSALMQDLARSQTVDAGAGAGAGAATTESGTSTQSSVPLQQIFALGNLELKTPYSSKGVVTWWYHVAPLVKTEIGFVVLDPSVDILEPLPLATWLSRIGAAVNGRVSICDAKAYSPDSYCKNDSTNHTEIALNEELETYFELEWNRVESLNLNPQETLGDNPPWKAQTSIPQMNSSNEIMRSK